MTSGSSNGWPDVIKVPARQSIHDPLCYRHPDQHLEHDYYPCSCDVIKKVRADERERIAQKIEARYTGWTDELVIQIYDDASRIARHGEDSSSG